jgi:hypothetical protein
MMVAAAIAGLSAGGVQAAQLTCGTGVQPVRISTANAADWTTDARYVAAPNNVATVYDIYRNPAWLDPSTQAPPMTGKWLSFGPPGDPTNYPSVSFNGVTANGAWVAGNATFIYDETITVDSNVDLSTIRITGRAGGDNGNPIFVVKPATLPGGGANPGNVVETTTITAGWSSPANINLVGNSRGFNHGNNAVGFAIYSQNSADVQGGLVADIEIAADCLPVVEPVPTLDIAGLGLLGLLSAGAGALAMRRRKRAQ